MAASERENRRGKTEEDKIFRSNASFLIQLMRKLDGCSDTGVLVDELLHSIFFLGYLRDPDFLPQTLLSDVSDDMVQELKSRYPRPFTHYSLQLPKRGPFSCVLDMFVRRFGEDENSIKESMEWLFRNLKQGNDKKPLASSTICISHRDIPDSNRYYGVSMSTSGRNPGKIMVAASCLSSWDSYVAGAVMTYYPGKIKDKHFDGTIKVKHVKSKTFSLSNGREMPPCGACVNLFGLTAKEVRETWAYGNCAEVESLSNLFKNDQKVREEAKPTSEKCTEKNRQNAEERVRKHLITLLNLEKKRKKNYQLSDLFYDPRTQSEGGSG